LQHAPWSLRGGRHAFCRKKSADSSAPYGYAPSITKPIPATSAGAWACVCVVVTISLVSSISVDDACLSGAASSWEYACQHSSPPGFLAKWCQAMLKERCMAQEHLIDMCRFLGYLTSAGSIPVVCHIPTRAVRASSAAGAAGSMSERMAASPGTIRASTLTSIKPTPNSCNTAYRTGNPCRHRRSLTP
jgi:hypothetical protein